ncbi:MAG: response regulator receiver [bacterium]|nr:MAG: response regulator receiver [bacterium]KAF0149648.1 MAG: response regulator receiver [bacterium]KAF0169314.1 MAG: response regulator receiver [bacterium]
MDNSPRVLVVDDDTLMRELLKALLRDEGFTVAGEAKDGQSALAQVDRVRPDLVCLDVNMPGMSGIDVLKAIKARCESCRVVMISGDASMATVREAVGYGAVGFIVKPFKAGRVGASLRAAMKAPADAFG